MKYIPLTGERVLAFSANKLELFNKSDAEKLNYFCFINLEEMKNTVLIMGALLSGKSPYFSSEGMFVMTEGTNALMRRN